MRANRPDLTVILTSGIVRTADKAGDLCQGGPMEGKPYHPQKCLNVFGALLHRPGVLPTIRANCLDADALTCSDMAMIHWMIQ